MHICPKILHILFTIKLKRLLYQYKLYFGYIRLVGNFSQDDDLLCCIFLDMSDDLNCHSYRLILRYWGNVNALSS